MVRQALLVGSFFVGLGCASAAAPAPVVAKARAEARPSLSTPIEEELGLEEDQIREVVESKNGAVRGCHTIEYAGRGSNGGVMTVDLEIDPDGSVRSAEIADSDFQSDPLHRCVLDITRRLRFPRASGTTEISWRYRFRSQG
jgi:TonB family protein